MMNLNHITVILLITFIQIQGLSQVVYDTIFHGSKNYEKLDFQIGAGKTQLFEINEIEVDINNGEIESIKQYKDTIEIQHDTLNGQYEISLSKKTWIEILYGNKCSNLVNELPHFPKLYLVRDKKTNRISFSNPDFMKAFILNNYKKRLKCLESLGDKFMKNYIEEMTEKIEIDSINVNSIGILSHFAHIQALFDLIVPKNANDTLIIKISARKPEATTEYAFNTTKYLLNDSTLVFKSTDKVKSNNNIMKNFVENMYLPLEKYHTDKEKDINKFRLASMQNEDKFEVTLGKNRELKRYLRIMESSLLNKDLNPKYSYYNYEIKAIQTKN